MTLKTDAALLLERLRYAHQTRVDAIERRERSLAHAAATIAQDLVDEASPELLRAALTAAVQPDGGQPPIPVVLGPQDAAVATVSVDEVMALAGVYAQAAVAHLSEPSERTLAWCRSSSERLRAAVEVLATAAVLTDAACTAMGG